MVSKDELIIDKISSRLYNLSSWEMIFNMFDLFPFFFHLQKKTHIIHSFTVYRLKTACRSKVEAVYV